MHLKFKGCTILTSVTIPSSVTSIDEFTFSDCTGLTSVTLPKSMTDIGFYAFSGCTGLTSITIPNSVTDIGSGAFSFCTGLTSITIPSSVTEIDFDSFLGCIGLNEIIIDKENKVYDSRDKSNAIIQTETNMILCGCKSTIIPNTVTSIGRDAFFGCTGLTSITIPNSVTDIGSDAFEYCTGLTSIHCKCKTPPNCDYSSFNGISAEVTLYVPKGSLNAYKEARGWGNCFKNIVEE